jgi:short subunit dehydrogenase-like uncharacterized protein
LGKSIVVFGSYGYTGKLIIQECKVRKLSVILAGRNQKKLQEQSEQSGYPFQVIDLDKGTELENLLANAALVIHCAGPFQNTATIMVDACLNTKTHYLDITGEFNVFETLVNYDLKAKENKTTIMPGVGFDVVPSDCLAVHLKNRLPTATHLQLAFTSLKGGVSRGTARTSVESLGYGSYVRKEGKLVGTPAAASVMNVNFGSFATSTVSIPWGDISTAYQSTGISNIEVFMGMPEKNIRKLRWTNTFSWLFKSRLIKNLIRKQIDKRIIGPSDDRRRNGRSFLWGKVWDEKGNIKISLLETYDGYTLTAKTSVLIAQKILNGNVKVGYHTPAMAYGPDLILEIESSRRTDI